MNRQLLATFLLVSLLSPGVLLAQVTPANKAPATLRASANPQDQQPTYAQSEQPSSVRPQSRAQRRSYARETQVRRHHGMSKEEKILLVGIAGSSMGIGALAAGGTGLAVGAIVGGWGAYLGHHVYHWVKR